MSQPSNRRLVTQQLKYRMRPQGNEVSIGIMEEVGQDGLNDSKANRNGILVSSQHINSERQPMNRTQDSFYRRSKLVASGLSTSVEDHPNPKRNDPYLNSKSATGYHAKGDYYRAVSND